MRSTNKRVTELLKNYDEKYHIVENHDVKRLIGLLEGHGCYLLSVVESTILTIRYTNVSAGVS